MKTTKLIILAFIISAFALQAQTVKKAPLTTPVKKIEAYYFHYTARCVTCKTVEAEAQRNLKTLYPQLVKNGMISFKSLNLDEKTSEALAKKLDISGQTLLLVKGAKKINITNEGFMYARSNPAKFKNVIKENVDELMKAN